MKKFILLNTVFILLISALFYVGCKKTTHPLYNTPSSSLLASYTKITTSVTGATNNYTYNFSYDGSGRVSTIYFASNDSNLTKIGAAQTSSFFRYFSDTIIKTVTEVKAGLVIEVDTFVTNGQGLIASAWTPRYAYSYQYFGKLLATEYETYRGDSGTSISADAMNFTSSVGDLLLRTFDGTFTANFSDRGYNYAYSGYLHPDTALYPAGCSTCTPAISAMTVTWTSYPFTTTPVVYTHSGVTGYSDQLTGYTAGWPLGVSATDGYGTTIRDTCIFPIGPWDNFWTTQAYVTDPSKANRAGDYLQLQAFTLYGMNVFNNNHLITKISNPFDTTSISYSIDADSRITQTYVTFKDVHGNVSSEVYKLTYETN